MDLADVHAWSMTWSTPGYFTGVLSWTPQKIKPLFEINAWHWRDLNPSLLHGSPVPNQLDHGGQMGIYKN